MAKIQVSTKINNENIDFLCDPHTIQCSMY